MANLGRKALFSTVTALLIALPATASAAAQDRRSGSNTLGACATFAADGTSAAVTFDANSISLDITAPAGKSSHLSLPLRNKTQVINRSIYPGSPNTCDAYFDHDGDLIAIGVDNLQVGVADLKTMKWVGDWVVQADIGIASPSLLGFLEGTTSLVVGGEAPAEGGKGIHWGLYAATIYDPDGKQSMPLRVLRYAPDGHMISRFPDAGHNRLWVFRCEWMEGPLSRQPLCPIASANMTQNQPWSPEFVPSAQGRKRSDLWFPPTMFATLDLNEVVFGQGTAIWAVNTETQAIHRYVLPEQPHFPSFEQIGRRAALSPDGQVMALDIYRSRLAFPFLVDNYVFQGTDIAVIQIDPLRSLGVLKYGRTGYVPGFAIDHREGRITVLIYRHGRWERVDLTSSSQH